MRNSIAIVSGALACLAFAAPGYSAEVNTAPAAAAPAAVGDLGVAILSAVINADGTLARGEGAVSSQALGTGNSEVIFGRSVIGCTYVSTVGSAATSGTEQPGYSTVVGRAGQPNGIFVQTFDTAGALALRGYHVIIYCGG